MKNGNYDYLSKSTYSIPSSTYPLASSSVEGYSGGGTSYTDYRDVKRLPNEYSSLRQTFDSRGNNKIRDMISKQESEDYEKDYLQAGKSSFRNEELEQKLKKYSSSYDQLNSQLESTSKVSEEIKKLKEDRRKRLEAKEKEDQDNLLASSYSSSSLSSSYKAPKLNVERNYDNKYDFSRYETKEQPKEDYGGFKKKRTYEVESPYTPKYEKKSYQDYSSPANNYDKYKKEEPKFSKYDYKYEPSPVSTSIYTASSVTSPMSKKQSKPVEYIEINNFILGKSLGEGKFGIVYQAFHKPTKWLYAIKKIPKQMIKSHFMEDQFILEMKLQTYLYHENILSLYTHFDDRTHIYLVLEYMEEGTLFSQLKKTKTLPQPEVAAKIRQVASAVKYLHENQIAHRDIKPENIVMSHGVCKLCDFGWATLCDQRRKTYCGTFDYAPPQILEGVEYDYTVDLWCLGVLTYQLLVGQAPFYHIKREQTIKKIKNVEYTVLKYPDTISKTAINFIDSLIKKDPKDRLSSEMLLDHPFLKYADKTAKNKQF